jgi:hypothetical protein
MKNTCKHLAALGAALLTAATQAQTVSTFESILTVPGTYWNGSDSTHVGGFNDGNAFFVNEFNSQFSFWSGGFAVSNKKDTTTADTANGFAQIYNAVTPGGAAGSNSYTIAQQGSTIKLTGAAAGKQPEGLYITNSNYTYLSMKWGDAFARQFTDSDFFVVNIIGFKGGEETDTAVTVYLADGTDLLNTWQWVNLKPLGDVDSIGFLLESSDTGQFGMNTPAFFCIDNFTTTDIHTGINQVAAQLRGTMVYPNPATTVVTIETVVEQGVVNLFDITGKKTRTQSLSLGANTMSTEGLQPGIYFLQLESNGINETRKLVIR